MAHGESDMIFAMSLSLHSVNGLACQTSGGPQRGERREIEADGRFFYNRSVYNTFRLPRQYTERFRMRLFTAIDIPGEIKARLQVFMNRLRPAAKLTWSPVENLHVTTKFIGEWPEPRLSELKSALASVPFMGPASGSIEIAIRGVGWFPNSRNPRVFFAGIESGPELVTLARDTDQALAPLGIPAEDREFHPHLTLARRRDAVSLETLRQQLATGASDDFGAFRAASFFLYLSASGRYTRLQEFPLTRI